MAPVLPKPIRVSLRKRPLSLAVPRLPSFKRTARASRDNRRKATYDGFFLDVIQGEKFGLRKVDDLIHGVRLKLAFEAWLDQMFGS